MTDRMPPAGPAVDDAVLAAVAEGRHSDPHSVLGQHGFDLAGTAGSHTVIRTRRPLADRVDGRPRRRRRAAARARRARDLGRAPARSGPVGYRVRAPLRRRPSWTSDDPYRFAPTIGELDLHLIGEGRHEQLWQVLGAHHREHWGASGGVRGTAFTVWAPHARAVRVVGDFNRWDGAGARDAHAWAPPASGSCSCPTSSPARSTSSSSSPHAGDWVMKADPMARLGRGRRRRPRRSSSVSSLRLGRRRLDGASRVDEPARRPDERLRAAPRLVAAGPRLPRRRRPAHRVRRLAGLHARRVHAPRGAPVRRVVGLPGHRATSRPPRGSAAPTTCGTSSTGCTRPASA